MLPDEIISEILSSALKVSDERFPGTSDVSPFAKYELSTSAYLVTVVCKDWLRVVTPLLYNVVVLRSRSQVNALEKVLDTRDAILDRVLFFAMDVEARLPNSGPHKHKAGSSPSRLAILLVSKNFNRLALCHLYERPNTVSGYARTRLLAIHGQLSAHPELGAHIHKTTDCTCPSGPHRGRLSGASWPTSLFAHFTALRELTLWATGAQFIQPDTIFAMDKLHTLSIESLHPELSLSALRILRMNFCYNIGPHFDFSVAKFLTVHGNHLTHLSFRFTQRLLPHFKLFDVCRALVEVEFHDHENVYKSTGMSTSEVLTCTTPHTALVKMILFSNIIEDPDDLDPAVFPALREIQIRNYSWPTTERAIAKSEYVPLAEAWLQQGIRLTDSTGQHWVPRVERARGLESPRLNLEDWWPPHRHDMTLSIVDPGAGRESD
ncbi:hypothetical protein C8R46DRAFT_1187964 [Mycena filopes]|nr:hypothetical protein C8R46DRAFT_1187964 [Mycena filopes]